MGKLYMIDMQELTKWAYFDTILHSHTLLHCGFLLLRYCHSSKSTQQKMICKAIRKVLSQDPEAARPELGQRPLLITELREFDHGEDYICNLLGKYTYAKTGPYPTDPVSLRPFGVSERAGDIDKIISNLSGHYPSCPWLVPYAFRDMINILIKDRIKHLGREGYDRRPRLREGYYKGRPVRVYGSYKGKCDSYLIAKPTFTLGFRDTSGNTREYFVIQVRDGGNDGLEDLFAYMCIIHENRKQRGETNSVVYGLHTDVCDYYKFYKINSASKISTFSCSSFRSPSLGYHEKPPSREKVVEMDSYRRRDAKYQFWDRRNKQWRTHWSGTEDVVTLLENILERADMDCYGLVDKDSDWTDEAPFLEFPEWDLIPEIVHGVNCHSERYGCVDRECSLTKPEERPRPAWFGRICPMGQNEVPARPTDEPQFWDIL
ncbi:uncharacterized protein DSM5745_00735 [Aspergillus mulundensis]|uniref:Uncharacterized protein n=1 Tax=Aspergillus mulundensis TaxID=1810919 RepID=A0A3D8T4D7_9EURO|nr:hypothetical protein DSM5745_00735 [Aspergillus mulundensis]RDW93413.1 hypothetical protein DSM5745_00735 [Aspergillus mulundensis]